MHPFSLDNPFTQARGYVLSALTHDYRDLIEIFNKRFNQAHQTELVRGSGDPIYLPATNEGAYAQIIFAHGYFSSALHEIAHWCIAGPARRQLEDYGYWYVPDGRNAEQQKAFELVEIKPQALEWLFSIACNCRFVFSADNLDGATGESSGPSTDFQRAVRKQLVEYLTHGAPNNRAIHFYQDLIKFYGTELHVKTSKENFISNARIEH